MSKKKMPALAVLVGVCIIGLIAQCGPKGDGNPVSGGGGITPAMTVTGAFRATDDTIFVTFPDEFDTARYCEADSLVVAIDTLNSSGESGVQYALSGNTLTLLSTSSSVGFSSGEWEVVQQSNLTRVGVGIGLNGTWNCTSLSYSVVSGTLPDSVRQEEDSMANEANQEIASGQIAIHITFAGNTFIESMTGSQTMSPADDYVSSWTDCSYSSGLDTCNYAVTVTKLSNNSVRLAGLKSNETVTIVWDQAGDETFSSSVAANSASTYYVNPTSCPDPYEPDWLITFFIANSKNTTALTKRAVHPVSERGQVLRMMMRTLPLR